MNTRIAIALLGVVVIAAVAESKILNPAPQPPRKGKSPEHGEKDGKGNKLIDGDIVPRPKKEGGSDRNAIVHSRFFWPKRNGRVQIPYVLDNSITGDHLQAFNEAKADYKRYTCVDWIEKTTSPDHEDYVYIFRGDGCYSYIGRNGGAQELSLGWGCQYKGIVIHEMMHATGFDHEQTRTDRDNYVQIMMQNVETGQEHNFLKCNHPSKSYMGGCTTQGYPYDCGSIMHYESYAFHNGNGDTIKAINCNGYRGELGQRQGFSQQDVNRINKLYQCA